MLNTNKRIIFPLVPLSLFLILIYLAGCAGPGSQVMDEGSSEMVQAPTGEPVIVDISSEERGGGIIIRVEGNYPLSYSLYQLKDPMRLALDLPGTSTGEFDRNVPVNLGPVSFVKPVQVEEGGEGTNGSLSRLEIFLNGPVEYDISSEEQLLALSIWPEGSAPPPAEPVEAAAVETETIEVEEIAATTIMAEIVADEAPLAEEAADMVAEEPAQEAEAMAEVAEAIEPAEEMPPASRVTFLDVITSDQGTQVVIEGDGVLEYEYFLVESRSLVVDIFGAANDISPLTRKVGDEYISQVRIGEHFEPRKKVRVVMDLAQLSDYRLLSLGDRILVNFGQLALASDEEIRGSLSNMVTDIYFRPLEDRSILEVATTREPVYRTVDSEDPNRLILEIDNSRVAPEAQKTLDLTSLDREISKIVSFQFKREDEPVARVVVQFRERVPYRLDAAANRILIEVPRAEPVEAAAEVVEVIEEVEVAGEVIEMETVTIPPPEPAAEEVTAKGGEAPMSEERPAGKKIYTGRKLSLDFKDADINDVMRLIADVSGINFVAGPEVKGSVTVKLTDVPWDQALDVILKVNTPTLTQIPEAENIIRITTIENVLRMEEQIRRKEETKIKVIETKMKLEPLVTRSFRISYAKVEDIEARVEPFMSDRRKVDAFLQSDIRTNTLIVRDLAVNIEEIAKIVEQLDTPTPAVLIEARIANVTSQYSRSLGIQWGFEYFAGPETGNATSLQWPNSVAIAGTEVVSEGPAAGQNFLVNLPATDGFGSVGMALGHIADTFNLDLRLSAGESLGDVELLSSPKIFTIQNESAIINVGSQLPVAITDSEGNRTVNFEDVGIILEVTPQVTADGRVFMDVSVENSQKGEDVATTEGLQFSIDTQRAETKVLLKDGETAVIGGLFQHQSSNLDTGIPWLSEIPGLGWLFKSKTKNEQKQELLIFLTPRIVKS